MGKMEEKRVFKIEKKFEKKGKRVASSASPTVGLTIPRTIDGRTPIVRGRSIDDGLAIVRSTVDALMGTKDNVLGWIIFLNGKIHKEKCML